MLDYHKTAVAQEEIRKDIFLEIYRKKGSSDGIERVLQECILAYQWVSTGKSLMEKRE